jgi:hypothetical protein
MDVLTVGTWLQDDEVFVIDERLVSRSRILLRCSWSRSLSAAPGIVGQESLNERGVVCCQERHGHDARREPARA